MSTTRNILIGAGAIALAFFLLLAVAFGAALDAASAASPASSGGLLNTAALPIAAAPYVALVEAYGSECLAISPALLMAQLDTESGFNAHAVSPNGAEGPAQFEPGTWAAWGSGSPFNPADAVRAQARYDCALASNVANLAAQTGVSDQQLMLAAYNASVSAVINAQGVPQNGQTPAYVSRIEALTAQFTAATLTAVTGGTALGRRIIAAAETQLGTSYSWGGGDDQGPTVGIGSGAGTVGYDCSGLVMFAVWQGSSGTIQLPHSAEDDSQLGQGVPKTDIAPGDIVAFALSGGSDFDHVGIYVGDGQMIDAPDTGSVVRLDTIVGNSYWESVPWAVRSFG